MLIIKGMFYTNLEGKKSAVDSFIKCLSSMMRGFIYMSYYKSAILPCKQGSAFTLIPDQIIKCA